MSTPKIGFVSLGCPKALVDSERILTELRGGGYELSGSYAGADLVVVNTCGFIDEAKQESLDAIGEALAQNGKVIVTGCLGANASEILDRHPSVLAVTGPHAYAQVVAAAVNDRTAIRAALDRYARERSDSLHLADVAATYDLAGHCLSAAIEAAMAEGDDELHRNGRALLDARVAHENEIMGEWAFVGRA